MIGLILPTALVEVQDATSNGFTAPALRTVANDADGNGRGGAATVRANPLKTNAETAADDVDPNRPPPHS
jgi:hypothetical protein